MSTVDELPPAARARETRGRADWPELPRHPARRARAGWLAPRREISPAARWTLRALSLLVPLAVWVALSTSGRVDPTFLPTPAATWDAWWEMARSGELWTDTAASVRRVLLGFGLALLISVPLGFAMGTWRWALAALEPIIGLVRYWPAGAFIPLLIIWLGLGESSKLAVLVIGVVFFNTLMVAEAVRRVPQRLLEASMTLGATPGVLVRKVIFPYALPGIIDAARVNSAAAWNLVVIAELFAATSGLGYRIVRSGRFLQTDRIFAVLIVIGVIGILMDVGLRLLRDRIGRWTP
ncbi:ABC transporter permease [Actinomadura craniellae]|uniref:ABC transporter permease n=1 Tax=Actinomadura craniellae TaxID=2231787 RepID=A0A365H4E4_9ACTN|nr:ABC transporter permease [Actinomadura craniellae]RAY13876.1 ABC transporter permease [Actinomadura craniellae]